VAGRAFFGINGDGCRRALADRGLWIGDGGTTDLLVVDDLASGGFGEARHPVKTEPDVGRGGR
jgi:hypothetical protein